MSGAGFIKIMSATNSFKHIWYQARVHTGSFYHIITKGNIWNRIYTRFERLYKNSPCFLCELQRGGLHRI